MGTDFSSLDVDETNCSCGSERIWREPATEMPGRMDVYYCDVCTHVFGYRVKEWPPVGT